MARRLWFRPRSICPKPSAAFWILIPSQPKQLVALDGLEINTQVSQERYYRPIILRISNEPLKLDLASISLASAQLRFLAPSFGPDASITLARVNDSTVVYKLFDLVLDRRVQTSAKMNVIVHHVSALGFVVLY